MKPLLVSLKELEGVFQVTRQTLFGWRNQGMPWPEGVKERGDLGACVRWAIAREKTRGAAKEEEETEGSDALERYRLARAKLSEHELAVREGKLIPREVLDAGLIDMAQAFRLLGEKVDRIYGGEARELVNESITAAFQSARSAAEGYLTQYARDHITEEPVEP